MIRVAFIDADDNTPVLETGQLILRPLRKEDVADLLFQRPKKPTKSFHWGVIHKQDHKVIGDMWVYLIENDLMAKVAFRLSPARQGQPAYDRSAGESSYLLL